jgi:hypothetical protein
MAEPLGSKLTDDTPLSVTLLVREWNVIVGILAKQPFELVAPVISKMQGQALAYGQPPPAKPNGPIDAAEGDEHGLAN